MRFVFTPMCTTKKNRTEGYTTKLFYSMYRIVDPINTQMLSIKQS